MGEFQVPDDIKAWLESVTNGSNLTAFILQGIYDHFNNAPESGHETDVSLELPLNSRIVLILAFTLSMAMSITGNTLVICVLLGGRRANTDLTASLINLAISDLTMAIFCMPFTFPTLMYGHWIFGSEMCYIVIFMQHVSVIVSIGTLTAVGIDRYAAVMNPMKARLVRSKRKIAVNFVIIWLSAVVVSSVQVVFTRVPTASINGETVYFCSEWYPSEAVAKAWEIGFLLATYFLPLSILTFTYARVSYRLWGRHLPGNSNQDRDINQRKSKQKVIRMLVVIVVMFALCWLPLHIFKLVGLYNPHLYYDIASQDRMRIVNACVLWLAMSNSFVNPIIYGFLNDNFRTDFKLFFKSCLRGKRHVDLRSMGSRSSGRSLTVSSSTKTRSFLSSL